MSEWKADPARPGAGSRVAGYWLEEQIAAGPSGTVFRARDGQGGDVVAVKILAPRLAAGQEFGARLARQQQAAALSEPHVLRVLGAGRQDGTVFVAMPYVVGGDCGSLLRRTGPLPPERVARIVSDVASALDAAHAAGLVHGDVKPANVLIDTPPGQPDLVYLADFGHAAAPDPVQMADQQALAGLAFELLTGVPPFPRDEATGLLPTLPRQRPARPSALRPGLPPAVDGAVGRALLLAPGYGYPNCQALAQAVSEALQLRHHREPAGPAAPVVPAVPAAVVVPAGPAVPGRPVVPAAPVASAAGPAATAPAGAPAALAGAAAPVPAALAGAAAPAPPAAVLHPAAPVRAGAPPAPPGPSGPPAPPGRPWPPTLVGGGYQAGPLAAAGAPRTGLQGREPWLVAQRRKRLRIRPVVITVVAVLVVAAAVTGGLLTLHPGTSPSPSPVSLAPVTASSGNPAQGGAVWVEYHSGSQATAQLSGTVRGAARGEVARLYGQQFPFDRAPAPVGRPAALHPAGHAAAASYSFQVRPSVATRYRVEVFENTSAAAAPLTRSGITTVYVAASRVVSAPGACVRPVCRQRLTVDVFVPPAALQTEAGKQWLVYLGSAVSASANTPAPPAALAMTRYARASAPVKVSADEFAVTVTLEFEIGARGYTWVWDACSQDSEQSDGLGLPGSHGCGNTTVPVSASYLG